MLKPYADRTASMRALVETVLAFTVSHAPQIQALRAAARQAQASARQWPVSWKAAPGAPSRLRFKGYAAVHRASLLGDYQRLAYDRNQPWEREIDYVDRFVADTVVTAATAYVIPQQWREVIERLQWNGVHMDRIAQARSVQAQTYRIAKVGTRAGAYEGHMFHDEVQVSTHTETMTARAGDYWLPLDQANPQSNIRYAIETLEPQAHDSFFRWGFFNSILERKEHYSDYVFEDEAQDFLREEPGLRVEFEQWKVDNPALLTDQEAVLGFIFGHCQRYREPEWLRYPVLRVMGGRAAGGSD